MEDRRLRVEIKACFQQQSYCYILEDLSVFIVVFPFYGGITDKCVDL
jgi:hypothetical protein